MEIEQIRYLNDLWESHSAIEYGGSPETELFIQYCLSHKVDKFDLFKLKDFRYDYEWVKTQNENTERGISIVHGESLRRDTDLELHKFKSLKKKKKFKIYRGQMLSGSYTNSWTLDKSVAEFFMNRLNNPLILEYKGFKNPEFILYEATIKGSDNFYYCNDRGEEEIFLIDIKCPTDIKFKTYGTDGKAWKEE